MRWLDEISYPESERFLEKVSEQITIGMHFDSIPTWKRRHHGGHTFDDGMIVGRHVDTEKAMIINNGVILIYALDCSTITYIVLSASSNLFPAGQKVSLGEQ